MTTLRLKAPLDCGIIRGNLFPRASTMLVIDTHIHAYPHFNFSRLFDAFFHNVQLALPNAPGTTLAMALVEREGVNQFAEWRSRRNLPPQASVEPLEDNLALRLTLPGPRSLLVLAGRQIACRERVEILGLGCQANIPDGTPAADAVQAVAAAGGVPVLAWGVGKWWFRRAAVVRRLLDRFPPSVLLLGDTSMRPAFWPEPGPMRNGRMAGRRVLAGSDPLPPAGEETMAGRYATQLDCPPQGSETTSEWIRNALRNPTVPLRPTGQRASLPEFIRRMR